jgi:3-deoxy-manno-octulosonate cytidylyltransferase (CMP-KDO synthetase)
MRLAALIPARYSSTRLQGKVLAPIAGKPMVQHVYQRTVEADCFDEVIVATDDERVAEAVRAFGGVVRMTDARHQSGTDRIAEVAAESDYDVIVNVQGDEPLIDPEAIVAAVQPFRSEPGLRMGTIATRIRDTQEHLEPSTVKVVVDRAGFALYFSRAAIPYFRIDGPQPSPDAPRQHPCGLWPLKHIGLYVYTRETLLWLAGLPRTPLEQTEGLEQLRALESGCPIRVVEVDYSPIGVDTQENLETVRRLVEEADTSV